MHGDVSVNNIMVRRREGKIFGVLNDYDLARVRGYTGPTSRQRTGTQPFMAMDLLDSDYKGGRTLPRFDVESLLYVLLWMACCGPGMKLPLNCLLRVWRTADWPRLLKDKYFMVSKMKWPDFNPKFKALGDTAGNVGKLLRNGIHAMGDDKAFEQRWLGRHFTEEHVRDALWTSGPQDTSSVWGWPNSIDLTQDPDLFDTVG
jgi:hypothetical protein